MALNYSHRPIFRKTEDNLGVQEKDNIHDILPDDPFEMDISSTVTAITGWLEDLRVSEYGRYKVDEGGVSSSGNYSDFGGLNFSGGKGQYSDFGGLNIWWDNGMAFEKGQSRFNTVFSMENVLDQSISYGCCSMQNVVFGCDNAFARGGYNVSSYECLNDGFGEVVTKKGLGNVVFSRGKYNVPSDKCMAGGYGEFVTKEALGNFFDEHGFYHANEAMKDGIFGFSDVSDNHEVNDSVDEVNEDESPHPALSFALAHLGVRDLLSVERVCKSLRDTVQSDPLLWRNIQIDHTLKDRITDDALVHLTDRAQGHLKSLSLVECKLITNEGLRRVLESNLRLLKLFIPRCINIKIEGFINCLKVYQPKAIPGIKLLRVAGRSVTPDQLGELKSLLGIPNHVQPHNHKPYLYHRGYFDSSSEDDRAIDLEICPKCERVRLVYGCTTETCQAQDRSGNCCRACIQCINRCYQCGRCIDNVVHEEDFFFDYFCADCLPKTSNCDDGHDSGSPSSSNHNLDG